MKKLLLYSIIIAMTVLCTVVTIAFLTPNKKIPNYSNERLREMALSKGLKPVPASFEKLLELVDDASNPMTHEKIALGKELFFDTNISKTKTTSCATCHSFDKDLKNRGAMLKMLTQEDTKITDCAACHLQDQSGVDRFTFSQGDAGAKHPYLLNTQTILNTAFAKHFTWSGEVSSIKEQSAASLQAPHKLNIAPQELEQRLKESPKYMQLFAKAFSEGISFENTAKAIEVYVKTLVTRGSYDRFLEGDNSAISEEAKKGLANFISFGCKGCHSDIAFGGQSIQRFPLREFAQLYDVKPNFELLPQLKRFDREFPFKNQGGYLGKNNEHLFRVPILRNVTKTSPYFHNGAVAKIREAVDVMARHQIGRHLTLEQIDEIVAFFRTLEGDIVEYKIGDDK
ncbi:cytochrome c peroxidase [Sulfurimonas sp.]|uniref:cytochrome-c peroxidase n=1 Tax=Sulfurimonas sp. TaxID=2022749 RepID=UPI0025DAF638|nr:cytochrome c peroxidase [Sulfurimonas sp.]MCK9472322.1 cytochrome-c peroxidase [Sulfurimonas sp.]